jgi:hypothetical protein
VEVPFEHGGFLMCSSVSISLVVMIWTRAQATWLIGRDFADITHLLNDVLASLT